MYQGVKGAPEVSKGVKRGVWGVQGDREECYGYQAVKVDPRGIQGGQGGVQVSQGVKRGVRGVPGVKRSLGDPKGLGGASEVY